MLDIEVSLSKLTNYNFFPTKKNPLETKKNPSCVCKFKFHGTVLTSALFKNSKPILRCYCYFQMDLNCREVYRNGVFELRAPLCYLLSSQSSQPAQRPGSCYLLSKRLQKRWYLSSSFPSSA